MKWFKKVAVAFVFIAFVVAPVFTLATPQNTFAASNGDPCAKPILGISPWFRGLAVQDAKGQCTIASPGQTLADGKTVLDLKGFILRIALNVVGIILGIIGYIAFFFVLYGGFLFLTGGSNPSQIEKARKTILNAVIGLVISLSAVAVTNLVFGIIG